MLIEDMASMIEKTARFRGSDRQEFLTHNDLHEPFNESLGDQRVKTGFFIKMCMAALENNQKMGGGQYITERRVAEMGLHSFPAPKTLDESLGSRTESKQLDIRIFSENGADILVATYIPQSNQGGIIVPKSIHESKIKERHYWFRLGEETYRIGAGNETEALEKLKSDHPVDENQEKPQILRVETCMKTVDDPEGPYKVICKNAEGERISCKEVRTLGGVLMTTNNKKCFEVENKDGEILIQVERNLSEPITEEPQGENAGLPPEVEAILKQIHGSEKSIVVIQREGHMEFLGLIPQPVEIGALIAIDNDTIVKVHESGENYTFAKVLPHVTIAESSKALMFKFESCEMPTCDCGKKNCKICQGKKNEGRSGYYGEPLQAQPFANEEQAVLERGKKFVLLDRRKVKNSKNLGDNPNKPFVLYDITSRNGGAFDTFAKESEARKAFQKREG